MSERDEVLDNWRYQLNAMDAGDADALRTCFTPDAVLVHMTGYHQPLDEWLQGVRDREFVYRRVAEHSVEVDVSGNSARLLGHITTGITHDGSGTAWPLRVEQDLVRTDGGWLCSQSRVTFDR